MPTKSKASISPVKKSQKAAATPKKSPTKVSVSQTQKKKPEAKAKSIEKKSQSKAKSNAKKSQPKSSKSNVSIEQKSKTSAKSKNSKKSETPKGSDKNSQKSKKVQKKDETKSSSIPKKRSSSQKSASQKNVKIMDDKSQVLKQVKPKIVLSPFIIFSMSKQKEVYDSIQSTKKKVIESSKIISQMWKALSEEEKKPFILESEKDKIRFEKESNDLQKLGYFIDKNGVKSTDLQLQKPKFNDHVVVPKNAIKPYIFFFKENFETLKKQNPNLKCFELSKLCSMVWNKLNDSQKSYYYELKNKDQVRYQNQIRDLATKGYFVNEKGEKSCDLKPKKKRNFKNQASQSTKSGSTAENSNSQISFGQTKKVGEKRKRAASTPDQKKSGKVQKLK